MKCLSLILALFYSEFSWFSSWFDDDVKKNLCTIWYFSQHLIIYRIFHLQVNKQKTRSHFGQAHNYTLMESSISMEELVIWGELVFLRIDLCIGSYLWIVTQLNECSWLDISGCCTVQWISKCLLVAGRLLKPPPWVCRVYIAARGELRLSCLYNVKVDKSVFFVLYILDAIYWQNYLMK